MTNEALQGCEEARLATEQKLAAVQAENARMRQVLVTAHGLLEDREGRKVPAFEPNDISAKRYFDAEDLGNRALSERVLAVG